MVQKEKITNLITPILDEYNVILYEVKWERLGKNKVLQIAIMNEDGSMDIDTCADVSERVSELLDSSDLINEEYFLEICSPGAERVLKTDNDILGAIGKHIYVKFKRPINGLDEVTGDLANYENDELLVNYLLKGVKKKAVIKKDDITLVRLAVKL